jgi:tRNA(Ile)-lysidine synthase
VDLDQAFLRHTRERDLFPAGARVLLALSGGADSTALAVLLHETREALGLAELAVAHLDHGLRPESAAEAERVSRWARDTLGLEAVVERREVVREAGESPEEAARRVRYRFLADAAGSVTATHVVTAHHADDQAETVLLRMLRGTGATGLRGISERRPFADKAELVRPLLPFRRSSLVAFLRDRGATWIEDPTNVDGNERARLRNFALPALREASGRDPIPLLARLAENLAGVRSPEPLDIARAFVTPGHAALTLHAGFERLPGALQAPVLRETVPALRGDAGLTRAETERLLALVAGDDATSVAGIEIERSDGAVRVVAAQPPAEFPSPVAARIPGETPLWDGQRLRIRVLPAGNAPFLERLACADGSLELADLDRLHGALTVRTRLPGDRLLALGAAEESRLGHLLQRRGVPARDRDRLPLLCDEEGIVWIVGVALADRIRVDARTVRIAAFQRLGPAGTTCQTAP